MLLEVLCANISEQSKLLLTSSDRYQFDKGSIARPMHLTIQALNLREVQGNYGVTKAILNLIIVGKLCPPAVREQVIEILKITHGQRWVESALALQNTNLIAYREARAALHEAIKRVWVNHTAR